MYVQQHIDIYSLPLVYMYKEYKKSIKKNNNNYKSWNGKMRKWKNIFNVGRRVLGAGSSEGVVGWGNESVYFISILPVYEMWMPKEIL